MRVLRRECPDYVTPERAFSALYPTQSNVVWLDSGRDAITGSSFIGAASRVATASVSRGTITVDGVTSPGSIFDFLRQLVMHRADGISGFPLGWIGWLGYELRAQTMEVAVVAQSRYPDAALLCLDRGLSFDHASQTLSFLALGDEWNAELNSWVDSTIATLAGVTAPSIPAAPLPIPISPVSWSYSDEEYLRMIVDCQAAIAEGEAYQLCLTAEASVDIRPNPLTTYLAVRESSPSHHGALIRVGEVSLLSASPEQFLTVTPDGVVETRPIKGTRARGATPQLDESLKVELASNDKERAENLMIVDLMRNDIARVSTVGSVEVTSLLAVETYAQVHQLVSTVRGKLAVGLTAIDAVESCFPAGSMTGAPKQRATQILDSLERRARGIYSGAFGYFGVDGSVDLAMVIRSIVLDAGGATVGSGGGITALSNPADELDEVRLKAAALLAVLGG
jgi:para-aminobenzoate synthetase component I